MATEYISVSVLRELLSIPPDGDCEKCEHNSGCYNMEDELVRACDAIDDAPEADVVEVVRCKDCKRWKDQHDYECPCHSSGDPYIDYDPEPDFFCAIGERSDDK